VIWLRPAPGEQQWCATNRRWFDPVGRMAGACATCRRQVTWEAGLARVLELPPGTE
jgi:hypothetical protein